MDIVWIKYCNEGRTMVIAVAVHPDLGSTAQQFCGSVRSVGSRGLIQQLGSSTGINSAARQLNGFQLGSLAALLCVPTQREAARQLSMRASSAKYQLSQTIPGLDKSTEGRKWAIMLL